MGQETVKTPRQVEPDTYEVSNYGTISYDEIEPIDDEQEFDVDELDADFEYGP